MKPEIAVIKQHEATKEKAEELGLTIKIDGANFLIYDKAKLLIGYVGLDVADAYLLGFEMGSERNV